MEQKQIHLTNNIKELENQKAILEAYMIYLFILLSNLQGIQALLNKVNIALENPKSLLILLLSLPLYFIFFPKDDDKDFKKIMILQIN